MIKCKNCLHENVDSATNCARCSIPLNETRIQTGASYQLRSSDGKSHAISPAGAIIGRRGGLSFPGDNFMSREHAKVSVTSNGLSIQDLKSQNGTFVNGNKVSQPQKINAGDKVKCGSTEFTVLNS